ncbi:ABC transporter ATP-binding protein [Actinophytocola glycyrrhizae]|uniref:ABC transporter ATP-binding protein n=1 Tax=Actinophytocola glycyrrhizae TaxID=2044873 RepID=A0ABV9S2N8_9PSEU
MTATAMTTEPLLVVRDLSCHIHTAAGTLRAVDGVSLAVERGQVLGVVGESGCGKSTLVRAVAGALGPGHRITGEVRLDGVAPAALPPAQARRVRGRRIGMVFQDPMTALNPVVPVGRQLTEGMRHHLGLGRAEARDRAIDLLNQVGVPDPARRLRHYPHQFSGGLRQRITIAIALSCEPDLLIADEATTALDVTVQRQILDLLADLAGERGMAMILVSHDLAVVAGRADHVAVMYGGRVVEHGRAAAVFSAPRHRYTEALLAAVPRLGDAPHSRLRVIAGSPPDPYAPPPGCPFAARCSHARADCAAGVPPLTGTAAHEHACLVPVPTAPQEVR